MALADATQASAEQAVPSVYNQVQARHATDAAPEPHGEEPPPIAAREQRIRR